MPSDKLIDRIQKLLRLAENNNSVQEASSAAAMAQKLMFEHKIAREELEAHDESDEIIVEEVLGREGGTKVIGWKISLLHSVAEANFCRVIYMPARRHTRGARMQAGRIELFGSRRDVDAVLYLYTYLKREINALCKSEAPRSEEILQARPLFSRLRRKTPPSKRQWSAAFRLGAVTTIGERLRQQREAQEKALKQKPGSESQVALIRTAELAVEAFISDRYPRLKQESRVTVSDLAGYRNGQRAASCIPLATDLQQQLGSAPRLIAQYGQGRKR